jgi:hypothetical protein
MLTTHKLSSYFLLNKFDLVYISEACLLGSYFSIRLRVSQWCWEELKQILKQSKILLCFLMWATTCPQVHFLVTPTFCFF